jgi:hypothetical protein
VPVGVELPAAPLTAIVTASACVVVMLEEDGVTVTKGVVFAEVTTTNVEPEALL